MRDNFSQKTIELLGSRVGWKCSNPNCRRTTCGAGKESTNVINIGVAAHITAAAKGGPRYDNDMSSDERKSYENGIWLCQTCSKLIDSDVQKYTVDKLKRWKEITELMAADELETGTKNELADDRELIKFFVYCFDRPAFRDSIYQEGRMEDFDKAIEDTIIALNTGVLKDRNNNILRKSEGKSYIKNDVWREDLNVIGDMLSLLRRRLRIAKETGAYSTFGEGDVIYRFDDRELGEWFDSTRGEILKVLSLLCEDVGIPSLHFPRNEYRW